MRVKLLVNVSGTRDGVEWPARGSEVDLPEAEARDMVAAGLAAACEAAAAPVAKKASKPAAKKAVAPEPEKRG